MILGRVVGEVWATRSHPGLRQSKLLIIQPHQWYDPPYQVGHLVAIDSIGAGVGEDVVVCMGDPARRSRLPGVANGPSPFPAGPTPNLPVDAAVMAIVDNVELSPAALASRPLGYLGPLPPWAGALP